MAETAVTVIVDDTTDILRIEGEHALSFYSIWNGMMMQAMSKEREQIIAMMKAFAEEADLSPISVTDFMELVEEIRERGAENDTRS